MARITSIVKARALCIFSALLLAVAALGAETDKIPSPDPRYRVGEVLFSDDFEHGSPRWVSELEKGGTVQAQNGKLVIDVPAGCTCWFKPRIEGPVLIRYDATVVSAGGPNDRVSDLNCFWMAQDPHALESSVFSTPRSGKFADYNNLWTYYVGVGGNTNTTSRFRRYIGDADQRPLLPEHDLRDPKHLLTPNVSQSLSLVACGSLIQFYRDGERLFEMTDAKPYTGGWFAIRTVNSHLEIRSFRVYQLQPATVP